MKQLEYISIVAGLGYLSLFSGILYMKDKQPTHDLFLCGVYAVVSLGIFVVWEVYREYIDMSPTQSSSESTSKQDDPAHFLVYCSASVCAILSAILLADSFLKHLL